MTGGRRGTGAVLATPEPRRRSRADAVEWARDRLRAQETAMQAGDWTEAQRIGSQIITELDRILGRRPTASP